MSTVTNSNSQTEQSTSSTGNVETLFEMEGALAAVLGEAISSQGVQSQVEQANGQDLLMNQVKSNQDLIDQLSKKHGFWHKMLGDTVIAVMSIAIVVSAAQGDFAGAAILTTLLAMQLSGGFEKSAGGLAEAMGGSAVAHVIADALVVAIATAASGGIAAAGDALASTDVAADALEKGVVDETENAAEKGAKKEGKSSAKKIGGSALMGFSAATGQVSMNLTENIMKLTDPNGDNEKLIGILLEVMLLAASIGGGFGGATMALGGLGSDASNVVKGVTAGLQATTGALEMAEGGIGIDNGVITMNMAPIMADLTRSNEEFDQVMKSIQGTSKRTGEIIQTFGNLMRENDFFGGSEAAAQALA